MRNDVLYLNNKIYDKFNGIDFVRTATANSHSSQTTATMHALNPLKQLLLPLSPLKWMLVMILNNQWPDGVKVASCLPNGQPIPSLAIATRCLDLKFELNLDHTCAHMIPAQ